MNAKEKACLRTIFFVSLGIIIKGNNKMTTTKQLIEATEKFTVKNTVIKANWKNRVISQIEFLKENNRFDGSFSTLKSIVKVMIDLEIKNYAEWKIRNSNDFKDTLTNKLY